MRKREIAIYEKIATDREIEAATKREERERERKSSWQLTLRTALAIISRESPHLANERRVYRQGKKRVSAFSDQCGYHEEFHTEER